MNLHKVQLTAPLGLAAAAANGPIYTSFDSGASWISNDVPAQQWFAIASSADGTRLAATAGGESAGPIYVSFNAGKSWKPGSAIEKHWTWVTASSDRSKWAAVEGGYQPGLIYTWQSSPPVSAPPRLSIRPSGRDLLICWPADASGFVLEQNSDFRTTNWIEVSSTINVAGGENQVLVSKPAGKSFYRLKGQ